MRFATSTIAISFILATGCASGPKPAENPTVSLADDIMPIMVARCGTCHQREGGDDHAIEHEVYFETVADIMGKVGEAIKPGDPDNSPLLGVAGQAFPVGDHETYMPPDDSDVDPWTPEELKLFETWIAEGAQNN